MNCPKPFHRVPSQHLSVSPRLFPSPPGRRNCPGQGHWRPRAKSSSHMVSIPPPSPQRLARPPSGWERLRDLAFLPSLQSPPSPTPSLVRRLGPRASSPGQPCPLSALEPRLSPTCPQPCLQLGPPLELQTRGPADPGVSVWGAPGRLTLSLATLHPTVPHTCSCLVPHLGRGCSLLPGTKATT